jgi:hypothetical protein
LVDTDDDDGEPLTDAEWAELRRLVDAEPVELVEVKSNIPGARLPDYAPANDPSWRVQKKRDGGCAYGPKKGWWMLFNEGRDLDTGCKTLENAAAYIAQWNAIGVVLAARKAKAPTPATDTDDDDGGGEPLTDAGWAEYCRALDAIIDAEPSLRWAVGNCGLTSSERIAVTYALFDRGPDAGQVYAAAIKGVGRKTAEGLKRQYDSGVPRDLAQLRG